MTVIPDRPNWTLVVGLPLLVMIGCTILVFSPVFLLNESRLSTGITLDLTLTAPLLYLLAIRNSSIPKMTVIRVFIAGLLLAGLLLHDKPHFLLSLLKTWVAPLAEGALLFIIARKFHRAHRSAKGYEEEGGKDFLSRCRSLLVEVTGNEKAGSILASEMAVLYYAFLPKKKRSSHANPRTDDLPSVEQGPFAFTSYKTNGILLVLGVFLCCLLVETTGLHFLLGLWSKRLAWILTALSAYTALQLYAHMRAIRTRPILVGDRFLQLNNGLAADVSIRLDNIEEIGFDRRTGASQLPPARHATVDSATQKITVQLALLNAFENHNILLTLKEPVVVNRLFGLRKKADALLFFVDRPEEFLAAVRARLAETE